MAAVTSAISAGIGIASAVGGAIKGARGTPAQKTTSQTKLAAKTPQQLAMEQQSQQAYNQQQQLANQFEQGIGAADQMRDPAIQAYLDQISGKAFQSTPEELQNIQNIRNAMVQLGTQDVDQFTQRGLTQATSGAAARGLRGQAMGALRGDVINEAQRQVGGISNQANLFAAQQAMSNPYARVQAQQTALNQGLTYGDQLRQQAQQNRQMLQSPFLMQQMQAERLGTAKKTSSTPAEKGGFWGGVTGAIAGAGTGLSSAANLQSAWNNITNPVGQAGQGTYGQNLSSVNNFNSNAVMNNPYQMPGYQTPGFNLFGQ